MGVTPMNDRIRSEIFPEPKQWAFLERARTMRVASLNDDGSIELSSAWFVVDARRLFVVCDGGSHPSNFDAGRVFSAVVDEGDEFHTLHGVSMKGRIESVTDPQLLDKMPDLLFEKYFHTGHPQSESYFEYGEWAGRRYFEIVPLAMAGWDAREQTQLHGRERRRFPLVLPDRLASAAPSPARDSVQ
ncbi:pyridoxamine 5'-phosphate oxidase family protein [Actinomycetes bacterium M1A6_2h]